MTFQPVDAKQGAETGHLPSYQWFLKVPSPILSKPLLHTPCISLYYNSHWFLQNDWLLKMSYHRSPRPHYQRRAKKTHYVILLYEIFSRSRSNVFANCWCSKFVHFSSLTMDHLMVFLGRAPNRLAK